MSKGELKSFRDGRLKHSDARRGRMYRLYRIWMELKSRCNNKNRECYKNYGGRGISVEWKDYQSFKIDMEDLYKLHVETYGETNTTIDRIDNDGNYCKENCQWATRKEQVNNSRRVKMITYKDKTLNLSEWSKELEINLQTLANRLNTYSWSVEKAFTTQIISGCPAWNRRDYKEEK